jgi:Uma2 family endonuclease
VQENHARFVRRIRSRRQFILEILSPYPGDDLTLKLIEYQNLPSVEEYVIVDSTKRWVRRYYRDPQGKFAVDEDSIGGLTRFESLGYTLDVDELYREVGSLDRSR